MDPNAALARLRELIAQLDSTSDEYAELAITFRGLDGWIKRGGFLPLDWRQLNAESSYMQSIRSLRETLRTVRRMIADEPIAHALVCGDPDSPTLLHVVDTAL